VAGDRKPFPVVQGKSVVGFPQVSSDGKWLAYASNETGRFDIYVKPFPKGDGKWQVSTDGGNFPRWRGDGKELYFAGSGGMSAADIRVNGSSLQPGVPHTLFSVAQLAPTTQNLSQYYNRFAVTADGQRFLVSQPAAGVPGAGGGLANAIIDTVDGGGGTPATGPNTVSVVLNWPQLLKQK
jgi:Tol biopolymer transport system component